MTPVLTLSRGLRGRPTLCLALVTLFTDFTAAPRWALRSLLPALYRVQTTRRTRKLLTVPAVSGATITCTWKSLNSPPRCRQSRPGLVCAIRLHQGMWIWDCGHRNRKWSDVVLRNKSYGHVSQEPKGRKFSHQEPKSRRRDGLPLPQRPRPSAHTGPCGCDVITTVTSGGLVCL